MDTWRHVSTRREGEIYVHVTRVDTCRHVCVCVCVCV